MNFKKSFIPLFILFVVTLIFYIDIIFTNKIYFQRDLTLLFYPWTQFSKEMLLKGEIPLWNPYTHCGMPFLANMQSGVFYPLNLPFYFFNFVTAFRIYIFIHFFLSCLFMYFLLRNFKLSVLSSIFGAIVWTFSGAVVTRLEFFSVLGTIIWLPLEFLIIKKLIDSDKSYSLIRNIFYLSIIMSIQFLAGHPQDFIYSNYALFLFIIFWVIYNKKISYLIYFFSVIIIVICITAIQFFPSVELILNSRRISSNVQYGLSYEESTKYSFELKDIKNIICPFFYKNFNRNNNDNDNNIIHLQIEHLYAKLPYLGIIGSIFAIIGLFIVNNKIRLYLIFLIFTCIILSLGKNFPFYHILYNLFFPLRMIRHTAKIMYITIFALSILSAFGTKIIKKQIILLFLVITTFFELYYYKIYVFPVLEHNIFEQEGFNIKFLKKNNGLHRFMITPLTYNYTRSFGKDIFQAVVNYNDRLYGNLNMKYKLFNFFGQDTDLKYFRMYLDKVYSKNNIDEASQLLSLANVRYILSYKNIKTRKFKLVSKYNCYLYENKKFLPRMYIVNKVIYKKKEEVLNYIDTPNFNPVEEVVLISDINENEIDVKKIPLKTEIRYIYYTPNEITSIVYTNLESYLVLLDTYYPGWKAYIDGNETPIYRANFLFRAIKLSPGTHEVIFNYSPLSFKFGKLLSIITLISLCLLILSINNVNNIKNILLTK